MTFFANGLILQSCWEEIHPDHLQLPDITETGENTFGCLVDGEIWAANGPPGCFHCGPNPYARVFFSYVNDTSEYHPDYLYVGARNSYQGIISQEIGIVLILDNSFTVGNPIEISSPMIRLEFMDEKNNCRLESDSTTNGFLQINRYDIDDGIVSGIFEAFLSDSCKTVVITEGRFDLTFRPK
ncbi:MAG: hypothetical protein ACNS60_12895 [Candidatus Cyclobacteriaceae bacterium M2_1C_046]